MSELTSDAVYAPRRNDIRLWGPYARRAIEAAGLGTPARLTMPGPSTNPVVLADTGAVVKFFTPYWCGPESFLAESAAYEVLAGRGLPVPRILARGELRPDESDWHWPYLVLSAVSGRPWREALSAADRRGAARLAASAGELLAGLCAVPLPEAGVLASTAPGFADLLRERRASTVADHRAWGQLSAPLLDRIEEFLPRIDDLIGNAAPVFVHGDLSGDNLFAAGDTITGLIDFNDVYAGDLRYTLVQLHLNAFRADRELLAAALNAADIEVTAEFPRQMLAFTFLHDFEVLEDLPIDVSDITEIDRLAETLWAVG
ncbi:aminoglycoside phosphotransferase family protein [Nocardia panacis]|uniref:Aminoglycoside phosphotransferase family protein n=1 Tax=Nocardia panacis TaxID=2340916 RepID=A0A3A4KB21_9NOCA|nr:aminoglycoside phosphotransferase family protein [Nocardia panacis]